MSQLTSYEKTLIDEEMIQEIRAKPSGSVSLDTLYLDTLSSWGVMCNHPLPELMTITRSDGRRCDLLRCDTCGCVIIGSARVSRQIKQQ